MAKELKLKSHDLLIGPGRAPARAMLKAVGFNDEDALMRAVLREYCYLRVKGRG